METVGVLVEVVVVVILDEGALDLVRSYLSYFPSSAWSYPGSLDEGDVDKLREAAEAEGLSLSAFVRSCVLTQLQRRDMVDDR